MSHSAKRLKELADDLVGAERRNAGAVVGVSHLPLDALAEAEAVLELEP